MLELYRQVVKMEVLGGKAVQESLCPLQIPHLLAWQRTRFSCVRVYVYYADVKPVLPPWQTSTAEGIAAESARLNTRTWGTGRNGRITARSFLTEDPRCGLMILVFFKVTRSRGRMGRTSSARVRGEKGLPKFSQNMLREEKKIVRLDVHQIILLKWLLTIQSLRRWAGFNWHRVRTLDGILWIRWWTFELYNCVHWRFINDLNFLI